MRPKSKEINKWLEENRGKHLCACGCGKEVIILRQYYYNKYIPKYFGKHFCQFRKRKYNFNQDYFELPLNQESAYIFGFIMADGNLYLRDNKLQFMLNKKDIDILEKIKISLKANCPIHIYGNRVTLDFYSRKLYENLLNIGVTERKTFNLNFPDFLDKELFSHFLRGYIDGDGSFHWHSKQNRPSLIIQITSGSHAFLENIKLKLSKDHNINGAGIYNYRKSFSMQFNGKESFELRKYLYKDATIYLERKKKIAFKIKERLMRPSEFSQVLGIPIRRIRTWYERHNLPCIKYGKFKYYSLENLKTWKQFALARGIANG